MMSTLKMFISIFEIKTDEKIRRCSTIMNILKKLGTKTLNLTCEFLIGYAATQKKVSIHSDFNLVKLNNYILLRFL